MNALRIRFTGNRNIAYVGGRGARTILLDLRGRVPVWSARNRAFPVLEATAVDVIAAAEMRGWEVVVTGPRWIPPAPLVEPSPVVDELEAGLW